MSEHDGHRQRMKNKMLLHSDVLEPHEVMETLLFYAIPRKNVNELAHRLLDTFDGSIKSVLEADISVLCSIEGVGENVACFLKTINCIIKRIESEKPSLDKIKNVFDAKEDLIEYFANANKEKFLIYFLGADDLILGKSEFSSNALDRVELNLQEIGRLLVLHKPASVLVAHNHLSGNPNPSLADDKTTKKLYAFLSLHNVDFYDHIIISGKDFFSYSSSGKMLKIKEELELQGVL